LIELLKICNIIENDDEEKKKSEEAGGGDLLAAIDEEVVDERIEAGGHRALIFCQMTSYLDQVVDYVLKQFNIKYVRLVSSLSAM
jgi:SNF2 family DNA or RNA helicase